MTPERKPPRRSYPKRPGGMKRSPENQAAYEAWRLESVVTVRCAFCGRGVTRRLRLAKIWFEQHQGRCRGR
jgi:hypothetical protein